MLTGSLVRRTRIINILGNHVKMEMTEKNWRFLSKPEDFRKVMIPDLKYLLSCDRIKFNIHRVTLGKIKTNAKKL